MSSPYNNIEENMKNLGFPFNKIQEPVITPKTRESTMNNGISNEIGKDKLKATLESLERKIGVFEKRYGIDSNDIASKYSVIVSSKGLNGFDDYYEWSRLVFLAERIKSKL